MAALQVLAAERALTINQRVAEMRIVSSDATANQLKLGFKKAVVIDLSADIRDVLVADPGTVKVILRTTRRVYIIGAGLGKTNIFFFDDDGRQIVALDVWVPVMCLSSHSLRDRREADRVWRHHSSTVRQRRPGPRCQPDRAP